MAKRTTRPRVGTNNASSAKSGASGGHRTSRNENNPRRRDQEVLEAAAHVFYEQGYSAATVQDVADELGILKGSLYHYIDTKEDLLFRLLDEVHSEFDQVLVDMQELEHLGPLEQLGEYVRRQTLHNLNNLIRISVYYHDLDRLSPKRFEAIEARRRPHNQFVTSRIKEAQKQRLVDPALDSRVLANCVFGTIIWPYRWYSAQGRVSRETIAAHCARYAIGGLTRGFSGAAG